MTYEGFRLKIQKIWRVGLANYRKRKLKHTDFTIISNNCWGGMVYESYNIKKNSPTAGLFFIAGDYIKFLMHLKEYLATELRFINPEKSRWKNENALKDDKRFGSYPVGILEISTEEGQTESIEIFFLHYCSEKQAKEKWERRIKRVNWDRLLVKFNDQNGCTGENVEEFDGLPFKNKVFFSVKGYPQYESVVRIKAPKTHSFIRASYEPYGNNRYVDVTKLLNSI